MDHIEDIIKQACKARLKNGSLNKTNNMFFKTS